MLYFAYVRSKLEYCSPVWNPIYDKYSKAIESLNNKFLKFCHYKVTGQYPSFDCNYNELLHYFNMESLSIRRKIHSISFLYKFLHGQINDSAILSRIPFNIPRLNVKTNLTFYLKSLRANYELKCPIRQMCSLFNDVNVRSDIHADSFHKFKISLL